MAPNRAAQPTRSTRFSKQRERIIQRAAETFGRKGFHATTLDDIAAELGVTKASLYYYFANKEELLYAVHLMSMEDHLDRLNRILEEHPDASPTEKLELAISEHLKLLASKYEGAFLLQQEYELEEGHRKHVLELRNKYERKFLDIIHEGVRKHLFRAKDERITVFMIFGTINWFLRWYRSDGRLTVEEIARAFVDSIFFGLLSGPAKEAKIRGPAVDTEEAAVLRQADVEAQISEPS